MYENYKRGLTLAILCSTIWGLLPIYWKTLIPIPSNVIIFYRIFWVGVITFFIALKKFGFEKIKKPLKIKGNKIKFFITGFIITGNWSIYIWAVNAGYVIQTSVGYYLQPVLICIFGIILFKEKITKYNLTALIFAIAGVLIMIVHFKQIPIIALGLAVTFATYSALKKFLKTDSVLSLFYETMFLVPIALIVIIYVEMTGKGALAVCEPYQYILLILSGVATALPLGLFNYAANNIPMVTLGITQYISPSIALILGIFLYNEGFDFIQFLAFIIIWIGLVIFTVGEIKKRKEGKY